MASNQLKKLAEKRCSHCGVVKPLSEFYKDKSRPDGHNYSCKKCRGEIVRKCETKYPDRVKERAHIANKKYREENKDKIERYRKEYYAANREQLLEKKRVYQKRYYAENKEEILKKQSEYGRKHRKEIYSRRKEYTRKYNQEHKEERRAYQREWQRLNKEKIKQRRYEEGVRYRAKHKAEIKERKSKYYSKRWREDPLLRLKVQARIMVRDSFRRKGMKKSESTEKLLGCSRTFFQQYLLNTWKDRYGFEWNGHRCHIDHIIPLSEAKSEDEVKRLCHYTNLQLLTPQDNLMKGTQL